MKNKKTNSILVAAILFAALAITAVPTMAGDFNSVYGFLYINDEIAQSGVIVKLVFTDTPEEIIDETDSNGYFQIDFDGHNWEEGVFSVKYKGDWYDPEGNPYVDIVPEEIGYPIDLNIEYSEPAPPPPPPPEPPGPPGPPAPPVNLMPNAVAKTEAPKGFIDEEITFDGTESTDSDGTITNYTWDFGDGTKGFGSTTSHIYDSAGEYTVKLKVTDNGGASDTDTTSISIVVPNTPPEAPIISGTMIGTKDESYDYTFVSIDNDGDDLQYNITWGDGNSSATDFYLNATESTESHSFSIAGIYTISALAFDNQTASGTTNFIVLIDAWWVKEIGYLIDYDANGAYEKFYSNSTSEETKSKKNDDGKYLIDEDGDGEWDWVYDKETDTLEPYSEEETDYTIWYALIILIILILIILGYLAGRKKKKPKSQKPTTKENPGKNTTHKKKK